jgi:predicted MPP superfamily phosphohydrolase
MVHLLIIVPFSAAAYFLFYAAKGVFYLAKSDKRKNEAKSPKAVGASDGVPETLLPATETAAESRGESKAESKAEAPAMTRRDFVKTAASAGLFGIVALSTYGVLRQSVSPGIQRVRIPVVGLPRGLDGFTVAHVTDIHLGLWSNQRELSRAMFRTAEQKPDMVIFTGDMVDHNPELAAEYKKPMDDFLTGKVPHGIYGVLGNHDHFLDPGRITELLEASGIRMLREERINVDGIPLSLTGLDDQGFHRSWLRRRKMVNENGNLLDFSEVTGPLEREGDFKILLNHRPEGFRQAAVENGFGLYLAGHTHGGQYSVPGFPEINLANMVYKYTSGLYSDFGSHIHVSGGLAAVGIPFRFGPWPEISVITLARA